MGGGFTGIFLPMGCLVVSQWYRGDPILDMQSLGGFLVGETHTDLFLFFWGLKTFHTLCLQQAQRRTRLGVDEQGSRPRGDHYPRDRDRLRRLGRVQFCFPPIDDLV